MEISASQANGLKWTKINNRINVFIKLRTQLQIIQMQVHEYEYLNSDLINA